jgi:hypothetical protein
LQVRFIYAALFCRTQSGKQVSVNVLKTRFTAHPGMVTAFTQLFLHYSSAYAKYAATRNQLLLANSTSLQNMDATLRRIGDQLAENVREKAKEVVPDIRHLDVLLSISDLSAELALDAPFIKRSIFHSLNQTDHKHAVEALRVSLQRLVVYAVSEKSAGTPSASIPVTACIRAFSSFEGFTVQFITNKEALPSMLAGSPLPGVASAGNSENSATIPKTTLQVYCQVGTKLIHTSGRAEIEGLQLQANAQIANRFQLFERLWLSKTQSAFSGDLPVAPSLDRDHHVFTPSKMGDTVRTPSKPVAQITELLHTADTPDEHMDASETPIEKRQLLFELTVEAKQGSCTDPLSRTLPACVVCVMSAFASCIEPLVRVGACLL